MCILFNVYYVQCTMYCVMYISCLIPCTVECDMQVPCSPNGASRTIFKSYYNVNQKLFILPERNAVNKEMNCVSIEDEIL